MEAPLPLSLVIPAFNEADVIGKAIAEAELTMSKSFPQYEILIVDDGSSDETAERVREQMAYAPQTRLIRHGVNRGYGAALRTGFEAARFPLVAFTDADCQFDLREVVKLANAASTCDLAVGYRVNRKDTRRRCFYSRGYNLLARTILGTGVRDVDCALKVFRRESLAAILPEARGFFVNTEMLARARWLGLTVTEHPVSHRPRLGGESKISLAEIPKTFHKLVSFWWSHVIRGAKPTPLPAQVQSWRVPVMASSEAAPPTSSPRLDFERDHPVEPLARHPVSV